MVVAVGGSGRCSVALRPAPTNLLNPRLPQLTPPLHQIFFFGFHHFLLLYVPSAWWRWGCFFHCIGDCASLFHRSSWLSLQQWSRGVRHHLSHHHYLCPLPPLRYRSVLMREKPMGKRNISLCLSYTRFSPALPNCCLLPVSCHPHSRDASASLCPLGYVPSCHTSSRDLR